MPRRRRPPRAGALSELQPLRIASQIALLQVLYYVAAVVFLLFTALVAGLPFGLNMLLGWDAVRGDTTTGWLLAFVWLLDGGLCMYVSSTSAPVPSRPRPLSTDLPLCWRWAALHSIADTTRAVAIVVLIARSKLVPDFALTIHFLHLLATTLYTRSLPRHAMWWATILASSALAVAAGTWGCRYRELQPVFFGGGRILGSGGGAAPLRAAPQTTTTTMATSTWRLARAATARPRTQTQGSRAAGGRGRGRDGAGEYEMVQMQKAA
ncbi:hypothetical protein ACCO45_013545 [Purpureocillium lilacinum]|uniref:Uncharacterized protein n=1 Tax=Purpureocillium lilacinum TaxID=33203 RepID=A0ACC4D793_PURLI